VGRRNSGIEEALHFSSSFDMRRSPIKTGCFVQTRNTDRIFNCNLKFVWKRNKKYISYW